jgi:GAF domain
VVSVFPVDAPLTTCSKNQLSRWGSLLPERNSIISPASFSRDQHLCFGLFRMASTTKKGSKNKKAKLRRPVVKTSPAEEAQTIAELRQELEARNRDLAASLQRESATSIENLRLSKELKDCRRQLTEALEQQTATSEILGVIASSPTDIQPVLDVVAETAARLCDAPDSFIFRPEGDGLRIVAHYGSVPPADLVYPFDRGFPAGRAVLDCQTIYIHDSLSGETELEYPGISVMARRSGVRTALNMPLLRGVAIGCIAIRRTEVRPFTDNK